MSGECCSSVLTRVPDTLDLLVKRRLWRPYLRRELDQPRRRLVVEAKTLAKLVGVVHVPTLYLIDGLEITMSYFDGHSLQRMCRDPQPDQRILHRVGVNLRTLHDSNIAHGNLLPSHILIRKDCLDPQCDLSRIHAFDSVCIVGWSSSYTTTLPQDKATDLSTLKRCLSNGWKEILAGYSAKSATSTVKKLVGLDALGRKKPKV